MKQQIGKPHLGYQTRLHQNLTNKTHIKACETSVQKAFIGMSILKPVRSKITWHVNAGWTLKQQIGFGTGKLHTGYQITMYQSLVKKTHVKTCKTLVQIPFVGPTTPVQMPFTKLMRKLGDFISIV